MQGKPEEEQEKRKTQEVERSAVRAGRGSFSPILSLFPETGIPIS